MRDISNGLGALGSSLCSTPVPRPPIPGALRYLRWATCCPRPGAALFGLAGWWWSRRWADLIRSDPHRTLQAVAAIGLGEPDLTLVLHVAHQCRSTPESRLTYDDALGSWRLFAPR